ncbi:MAG: tetratricopeptide repeat protein, partial [Acidobacteriota bacterium]
MSLHTPSNSRLSGGRSLPKAFALGALFALAGSFGLAPGAHAQPIESESLDSPTAAATGELAELEQLAQESFTQDDLETAVALYRQLAGRHESTGEKVRILTTVAWLEHERGRAQSALETLTRVLVMQPEYSIRPDLYSDAFTALFYDAQKNALEEREAKASRLVRAGAEQLRERRYDEARRSFQDALATWSEQPKAIYNLALVDYYQSRDDEALGGFQKLLALASSRPDLVPASLQGLALTNLGLLYLNQNQPDEAGRVLEDAVRLTPSSGTAWSNLAITRRRLGDPGGAADAARKALDLAPDDVGAHRSLALALLDADRPQEAAELLVRSTRDFAEDGGLWLYSGLADRRLGR